MMPKGVRTSIVQKGSTKCREKLEEGDCLEEVGEDLIVNYMTSSRAEFPQCYSQRKSYHSLGTINTFQIKA